MNDKGIKTISIGAKPVAPKLRFRSYNRLAKKSLNILKHEITLKDVDLIFASEYFEHFYEPIAHLKDILDNCNPKFLVCANGFTGDAIGHFDFYRVDDDLEESDKQWGLFSQKGEPSILIVTYTPPSIFYIKRR